MKRYILGIFTIILTTVSVSAQEQSPTVTNDTTSALSKKELRKQRVARRNFHYNILGGPSYTPDFGALIGGSALMTFRMNPGDTTQLRSVLPMSIAYMFKGGVNLMVKPQLFFKGDRFRIFGKFVYKNTEDNFYRLEMDYRQYKSVGRRKVLAWTAQSKNVFGNVPLTQYSLTGTPFDLRGYYMGQYRDKSSHVIMAEYRQMINTDRSNWMKRMLHHIGFVAWTGCGFMGPTMGKIEGVLPNYGVGLRIEVQPRMNVRLDLGKNTVNNQTLFYFNMTEAF